MSDSPGVVEEQAEMCLQARADFAGVFGWSTGSKTILGVEEDSLSYMFLRKDTALSRTPKPPKPWHPMLTIIEMSWQAVSDSRKMRDLP
ncbi:MAG: hypothetical protein U0941_23870 [Planctomycetaceae bacterium]